MKQSTPVFIFSLPRSGSTLLQRLLSSHADIASTAEPWLLLPLFYGLKDKGIYTEYAQFGAQIAMQDMIKLLPEGEANVREAVRLYAGHVYSKLSQEKNAIFFIDKTPRYHLIAEEILQTFPDAKFIFLWRDPVAIAASIVDTWDGDYWTTFKYKIDLFKGLSSLLNAFEKHQGQVLSVSYESLLQEPETVLKDVCGYIGVEFNDALLGSLKHSSFDGRLGDPTGVNTYQSVNLAPLEKWKKTICNPYRKYWCKQYIRWIGEERMQTMGYSLADKMLELDNLQVSSKYLLGDILMQMYGVMYCVFELRLFRDKLKKAWKEVVFHG